MNYFHEYWKRDKKLFVANIRYISTMLLSTWTLFIFLLCFLLALCNQLWFHIKCYKPIIKWTEEKLYMHCIQQQHTYWFGLKHLFKQWTKYAWNITFNNIFNFSQKLFCVLKTHGYVCIAYILLNVANTFK